MKTMTALFLVTLMSITTAFADTRPDVNSAKLAKPTANANSAFENFTGMEQLHSLSAQEKKLAGGIGISFTVFSPIDPYRVYSPIDPYRVFGF